MKIHIYLLALAPLALGGCVTYETRTPVATTEISREITTTGPVTREVVVTQAPPAVRIETQTVSPGANYVWTRGYWGWRGGTYVWVPGSWVVRPRPAAVWVDGHWLRRGGRYVWVAGRWR